MIPVQIADGVLRFGGDDFTAPVFEGAFPIPDGVSYDSYLIRSDGVTCLLDTVDESVADDFWDALCEEVGDSLDYIVVSHMEPDHGARLRHAVRRWPGATVVASSLTFDMLMNFYHAEPANRMVVGDGDVLEVGSHRLVFLTAPMVHWPEVVFTFDETAGVLFSADAFGTFGALGGAVFADELNFERDYLDEARRYYSNIVGRYGPSVRQALEKVAGLDVRVVCPLHGPVWRRDIDWFVGKYMLWSGYEPEERGVAILYNTVYGNTARAARLLAGMLESRGVAVSVVDLTAEHPSHAVSEAFRFSNLVFAATTYNNNLHPKMSAALEDMEVMAVQNRRYSVICNGSWAPRADKLVDARVSAMKNMTKVGESVVIKSALAEGQEAQLEKLADEIAASLLVRPRAHLHGHPTPHREHLAGGEERPPGGDRPVAGIGNHHLLHRADPRVAGQHELAERVPPLGDERHSVVADRDAHARGRNGTDDPPRPLHPQSVQAVAGPHGQNVLPVGDHVADPAGPPALHELDLAPEQRVRLGDPELVPGDRLRAGHVRVVAAGAGVGDVLVLHDLLELLQQELLRQPLGLRDGLHVLVLGEQRLRQRVHLV